MNAHLFGAVSSPSCSNFPLRKATDGKEESTIERIRNVRHACARGWFNLAKFVSNSKIVLESILEEERGPEVRSLELGSDYYPV